jgi:hypothetical protein
MAFACREEDTRATKDKNTTFTTPAGHTSHETGANERVPNDRRGVPDYAEPYGDAGVADARTATP